MIYVFDLDGVLYRMDEPIPGAVETVHRLQARGDQLFYLTNNSSKSRADYVVKLGGIGIESTEDQIMTSAYALGRYFEVGGHAGKSIFLIGESGLQTELESVGMRILDYSEDVQFDFVVSGWDRQVNYWKLAHAHLAVKKGAQFIATNRDATYPDAGGRTLPGSGAVVAALECCTGVTPLTIGKPETFMLDLILKQTGAQASDCLVIGDRLDTDIGIGKRAGARTALVLTGVHGLADVELHPELRPDLILTDLTELE